MFAPKAAVVFIKEVGAVTNKAAVFFLVLITCRAETLEGGIKKSKTPKNHQTFAKQIGQKPTKKSPKQKPQKNTLKRRFF